MVQWAIELSEFGLQYKPHLALKGQILANFLAKFPQQDANPNNDDWWIFNVDTSRQKGVRVRLQLKAPIEERMEQAIKLDFPASNNETEYEAILDEIDLCIFRKNHHTK